MKEPTDKLLEQRVQLGKRIRQIRLERGFSQEQLALKAGLDRSYAGAVERGERNLGIDNLARLAIALKVEVRDLF